LELRQGQGLVITPQLQQAIKLLQLSNLELDAFVEAELERNPCCSAKTARRSNRPEVAERATENPPTRCPTAPPAAEMDATPDDVSPGERATGDGLKPAPNQAGGQIDWSRAGGGGNFEGDDNYEQRPARAPTLASTCASSWPWPACRPPRTAMVAGVLIDAVDEGGYLRADLPRSPSAWAATWTWSKAC
jgi:RNA polymerase sigma-54 factor